jgi:hypothetical protein
MPQRSCFPVGLHPCDPAAEHADNQQSGRQAC